MVGSRGHSTGECLDAGVGGEGGFCLNFPFLSLGGGDLNSFEEVFDVSELPRAPKYSLKPEAAPWRGSGKGRERNGRIKGRACRGVRRQFGHPKEKELLERKGLGDAVGKKEA